MLLTIPDLLDAAQLDEIRRLLADAPFVDGGYSAGADARQVKHNQEVDPGDARVAALNRLVLMPLYRHPEFQGAALPSRLSGAFFARYQPGMRYGSHVDDPVMGPEGGRYRTDVSVTVFLGDPGDYDGGELVVETEFGEQAVKLPAGHAVLYPSSSLHRVAPVTRGQRLVAVAWAQSMVRDPARRRILYDLYRVHEDLRKQAPEGEATRRTGHVRANLMRMWAEV
ncbi:Fe2+-dependent dioxygenase [Thioalkalivibrio denitrificans]|uniref:Fe2+-dependent dioxygenase n=1 Tax=Thioalkalivibrio denitrificans TaxID=108003 RepID=A0A1V3NBS9_9GAMM|nr:Fe2+-dependent dioxygenase [Thioalkalivibrio denitrificans]OOG22474.1 Fe2+-dependent dioxygenase [Thioalkalivibrio denitrificans]